ncbi:MAG: KOW domain-containing RNA-binding protein [Lachnospiraceae bacterium]|nr:KOW domain-containing RNA-binding protein [Lachnospiraceae bacterium]
MIGTLVKSKAGHDKGTIYIVISEDEKNVYVSDGRLKSVELPKKKNIRHIQPIKKGRSDELVNKLLQQMPVRDEEIKRIIKLYQNGN